MLSPAPFRKPRKPYPSDISDAKWEQIDLLLPTDRERGRPREHSLREIVNAINYRWTTGCSWRMLPHDLPSWKTVYLYYRRWQKFALLTPIRTIILQPWYHRRDLSSQRMPEFPARTNPQRGGADLTSEDVPPRRESA